MIKPLLLFCISRISTSSFLTCSLLNLLVFNITIIVNFTLLAKANVAEACSKLSGKSYFRGSGAAAVNTSASPPNSHCFRWQSDADTSGWRQQTVSSDQKSGVKRVFTEIIILPFNHWGPWLLARVFCCSTKGAHWLFNLHTEYFLI